MTKRSFRIGQIDLKGSEPILLLPPLLFCLPGANVLAAFMYVLGIPMGACALAWLIQNRPDLFKKRN